VKESIEAGEGVEAIKEKVGHIMNIAKTSRAEMIAHTETSKALNFGTLESYKQSEVVEKKEWLVNDPCPICTPMAGEVVKLDEAFSNGLDAPPVHPRCFLHHSTKIITDEGIKNINKIKVGDNVLTHKGRYRKVIRLLNDTKRYKGEAIKIRFKGSKIDKGRWQTRYTTTITPEHPFLATEGWIEAKDLTTKHNIYVLASECKYCGTILPFWKTSCGNKCALTKKVRLKISKSKTGEKNWMYNRTKEKHHSWKGGKIWWRGKEWNNLKREIIKRDNFRCQECGMIQVEHLEKYKQPLHVHHITPYRQTQNNSLDNLITLCCVCHSKTEGTKNIDILKSGGATFISVPVLEVKKIANFEGEKRYNFAVEEDESYIANGLVVHNCVCTLIPVIK